VQDIVFLANIKLGWRREWLTDKLTTYMTENYVKLYEEIGGL
jgi:hypothetical protein